MPLSPAYGDFEVQTAVVRRRNCVRKAGADGVVRPGQPFVEQPAGTDVSSHLFVVREVQLNGAIEHMSAAGELLQRKQRVGVSSKVRLAHGDPAAVHGRSMLRIALYLCPVRITSPTQSGGHHIAMCIERNAWTAVAETMPNDEVGRRNHADPLDRVERHRMSFDGQSHGLQQRAGSLRMCRTITGRVVGGSLDYFGQEVAFGSKSRVNDFADLGFESRCHMDTGKFNRKSLKA